MSKELHFKFGIDEDDEMDIGQEFLDLKYSDEFSCDDNAEDEDSHIFQRKSKKKKKRTFHDDKIDLLLGGDEDYEESEDDFLFQKKGKKNKKRDIFDLKEAKKKRKKDIDAAFNPEITTLRKILKDADLTYEDIRSIFNDIKDSKARGVGKMLTDLLQSLNVANSNRASIVREISNIKKSMFDLKMKRDKGKKDKDSSKSDEEIGINVFSRLFSGGANQINRKNIAEETRDFYNSQYDEDEDMDASEIEQRIGERLDTEEVAYRSADGNKYIEYEKMGPKDCIFRHMDGSWETGAVDKNNQRMPDDYPVIPKEDLGHVMFDSDEPKATDETGRAFRVIDIP